MSGPDEVLATCPIEDVVHGAYEMFGEGEYIVAWMDLSAEQRANFVRAFAEVVGICAPVPVGEDEDRAWTEAAERVARATHVVLVRSPAHPDTPTPVEEG